MSTLLIFCIGVAAGCWFHDQVEAGCRKVKGILIDMLAKGQK